MAHPDMDALLNEGLQTAIHFLEKSGEFFPFGVSMTADGEISHNQGWAGDERPPSQELIDLLLRGFAERAEHGEIKATALIYDVVVSLDGTTKSDAISITVEHAAADPVTCFLPYWKNSDAFEFGELVAEGAERRVFKP